MTRGKRSWWQRPSWLVPLGIAGLILFGLAGFKIASESGLKREMEAIRAKGLPTNPKELDAWYAQVPIAENAALKFLEAHGEFVAAGEKKDPGMIEWRDIAHDERLDAETVQILESHLAQNQKTLTLMREAAKLKRSRYPTDLSRAPEINFQHLVPIKGLAQLARWDAVLKAERGDAQGALDSALSGFAVARTLSQEPLLISELVRIACVAIQRAGLERVVNVAEFDEVQMMKLKGEIEEAARDCRRSFERAMVGERAFANTGRKYTFAEYDQMISWGGMAPVTSEAPEIFRKIFYYARRGVGMHDRDHAFYMRSLGRIIALAELEHPEFYAGGEALEVELALELSRHPIALELSAFSLPAMFHVPRNEALLVARLRCAEAALDIELWRRKNGGRMPREEELVPEVFKEMPRDPVDGKPLKFRLHEKGYRIVAIAAADAEKKNGANAKAPDLGFSIVK